MPKEKQPGAPPEIKLPGKLPEIEPPVDPEDPVIPIEDPVIIPDEAPFENPPTEIPEPGEGL